MQRSRAAAFTISKPLAHRGAVVALPTPLSPGALPVLPSPAAPGALLTPAARTWAGQDPKTHENKPAPFSSPRNAGCGATADLSPGTVRLLPLTRSRGYRQRAPWLRGLLSAGSSMVAPGPQHRQWQGGNHLRPSPRHDTWPPVPPAVWASPKQRCQGDAERATPPGAPCAHPVPWRGLPGPLPRSEGGRAARWAGAG